MQKNEEEKNKKVKTFPIQCDCLFFGVRTKVTLTAFAFAQLQEAGFIQSDFCKKVKVHSFTFGK